MTSVLINNLDAPVIKSVKRTLQWEIDKIESLEQNKPEYVTDKEKYKICIESQALLEEFIKSSGVALAKLIQIRAADQSWGGLCEDLTNLISGAFNVVDLLDIEIKRMEDEE
jgi:hypothetical protein